MLLTITQLLNLNLIFDYGSPSKIGLVPRATIRDNTVYGQHYIACFTNRSYTMESIRSYDSTITPYGKTLFPFIAENPNELTFFDNEIVVLIRYVDEQWMEGEISGQRGIFPINYIDVIVDCEPYDPPSSAHPGNTEAGN